MKAKTFTEQTRIIQEIESKMWADLKVQPGDLLNITDICKGQLPHALSAVYRARQAQKRGEKISEKDINVVARWAHLKWFIDHPEDYQQYLDNAQTHVAKKLKDDMEVFALALQVGELPLLQYVCPEC